MLLISDSFNRHEQPGTQTIPDNRVISNELGIPGLVVAGLTRLVTDVQRNIIVVIVSRGGDVAVVRFIEVVSEAAGRVVRRRQVAIGRRLAGELHTDVRPDYL